jgi:hypothetical protein
MLGKLFKHEMKAQARLLLPLLGVLAALTIVDCIVFNLGIFKGALAIIPGFIAFAYGAAIVATIVVSSVIIILRFYKNLMSDEGYLMFTLPVKSHDLINSKLIASILWNTICFSAVIASIGVVITATGHMTQVTDFFNLVINEFRLELGDSSTLFMIELIVMIFLSVLNSVLMIYVSIAIGQLFNGHKVLGSFGAYIVISIAVQIISTIATLVVSFFFSKNFSEISAVPQIVFPLTLLFLLVFNIAFYWVTDYIFRKKLNLD